MCESCAWGYSRAGKHKCGICPPLDVNIVRIVFVIIAMVAYSAYQVWTALKKRNQIRSHPLHLPEDFD